MEASRTCASVFIFHWHGLVSTGQLRSGGNSRRDLRGENAASDGERITGQQDSSFVLMKSNIIARSLRSGLIFAGIAESESSPNRTFYV